MIAHAMQWIGVAVVIGLVVVAGFFIWKKKRPDDEAKVEQGAKDLYNRFKK